jgi:hypothetical protein
MLLARSHRIPAEKWHQEQSITAVPIPPIPPNMSPLRLRLAAACSMIGIVAVVLGSVWSVLEPWTMIPGALLFIASLLLLVPFLSAYVSRTRDEIRQLFRDR